MDKSATNKTKIRKRLFATFIFLSAVAVLLAFLVRDGRNEEATCPVHDVPLRLGASPISYGLPVFESEYFKAKTEKFPFSYSTYLGGCMPKTQRIAIVRYCPICRQAEEMWEATAQA